MFLSNTYGFALLNLPYSFTYLYLFVLCSIWTAILFATSTAVVSREKYFVAFVLIFQALTNASFPWQGSKSMRLDTEEWVSIEQYVTDNSEVQLSHGICERCLVEHY